MENFKRRYRATTGKLVATVSVGFLAACGGNNMSLTSPNTAHASSQGTSNTELSFNDTAASFSNESVSAYSATPESSGGDLLTIAMATTEESTNEYSTTSSSKLKPGVNLTYPKTGVTYNYGDKIGIGANAWDQDGSVTKVTFYTNNKWIGRDTKRPYHLDWRNAQPGKHKVFVMAHDNSGLTIKSTVIDVTVRDNQTALVNPKVNLTAPSDLSTFTSGAAINVKANAWDTDGNIKKVDFYSNGSKLGTDWSAPYEYRWTSAATGSHDVYAVATDNDNLTTRSSTNRLTVNQQASTTTNTLVNYPVNSDISGSFKSNRFGVKITQNGKTLNSFVYKENNKGNPTWAGNFAYMQAANHWTTFSFKNWVKVETRRLDGKAIKTCVIRPKSLKIQPTISGNKCTFTLEKDARVSVEIDENYEIEQYIDKIGKIKKHIVKHPLFIFANPIENDIPNKNDPNVIYFGPGVHEIGKNYAIPNNTTVYLAGGSYVVGTFITPQKNPQNITIRGRGILSGEGLSESNSENATWSNHAIAFTYGGGGKNLLIEGITIVDPLRSCIISYSKTDVRNVKMMSWRHRNDGIAVGNGSTIENNFIKVQDDNIKLYYSDQLVRNNVIWQQTSGSVFKFAWDLNRVAQNNTINSIDIIHSDVFFDYPSTEPDRPEFHSTNAIFSAMGFKKDAAFKNNAFKWIRIEERYPLRLMSLRMVSTHQTPYAKSTWGDERTWASKTISNITIDNISLAGVPWKKSTFYGNNGGTISNISISNLKIKGTVIPNKGSLTSRIDGVGIATAGNVSNIVIKE